MIYTFRIIWSTCPKFYFGHGWTNYKPYELIHLCICSLWAHISKFAMTVWSLIFLFAQGDLAFLWFGGMLISDLLSFWQFNYSFKHMFVILLHIWCHMAHHLAPGMNEYKVYLKSVYYYHFMILLIKIDIVWSAFDVLIDKYICLQVIYSFWMN